MKSDELRRCFYPSPTWLLTSLGNRRALSSCVADPSFERGRRRTWPFLDGAAVCLSVCVCVSLFSEE